MSVVKRNLDRDRASYSLPILPSNAKMAEEGIFIGRRELGKNSCSPALGSVSPSPSVSVFLGSAPPLPSSAPSPDPASPSPPASAPSDSPLSALSPAPPSPAVSLSPAAAPSSTVSSEK